jgi:hypothetical protein
MWCDDPSRTDTTASSASKADAVYLFDAKRRKGKRVAFEVGGAIVAVSEEDRRVPLRKGQARNFSDLNDLPLYL